MESVYKNVPTNNIGEQDQELRVENSKIQLVIYEGYLKPIKGSVQNSTIILDNGDTLTFKKTKDGLITYKGELVYIWVYKK